MMTHLGLRKTTLVDVPGRVAATVFTHGCPLRCPYCHNAALQGGTLPEDFLPREEVLAYLRKRSAVLEAVCVTGGEPLIHTDLPEFLAELRASRFFIKLDTSGVLPRKLEQVIAADLVDMVALDLKTAWGDYASLTGGNGADVRRSLEILRRARAETGLRYELRTTLAPGVATPAALSALSADIQPSEDWVLAQFRPPSLSENPLPQPEPYAEARIREFHAELTQRHPALRLRGVSAGA